MSTPPNAPPAPPPPGQHAQTWHGWRPPPPPPPAPPPPPLQPIQAVSDPPRAIPVSRTSVAPQPPQQPTQTFSAPPTAAPPPPPPPPPPSSKRKDADLLDIFDEIDFDEPEEPPEPGPTKPKASEAQPASGSKSTSKGKSKAPQAKNKEIARQTQHSKELITAFKPIKYFLIIIGQMPFVIKPKKDGTYSFKFYKLSGQFLFYSTMFFISFSLYFFVTMGIVSFVFDSIFWTDPQYTVIVKDKTTGLTETWKWERYIIRHEMVAMIVVWSWLTVACAGSMYIVLNSKYYVHYMNYFNRVVQIMDMDMTPGVSAYLFINNIFSLVVAVALTIGFIAGYISDFTAVTNTCSVIANFILRLFKVELETYENQFGFEFLGFFVMIYAFFASRANMIQFLFFSQLLKNGSKIWNERLRKVLTHDTTNNDDDQYSRRLEARLIYKDHLMIVQLYQMTENVFGIILFFYYSLTIMSVVMELYQLATLQGFGTDATQAQNLEGKEELKDKLLQDRLGLGTEEDTTQEHEVLAVALVSFLLLFQNVYFCYRTTVDAAKAYEYAMKGFDILRRHGLMYCKNKTDRNFVLSLYFSFAKNNPLQLTAGGYFAINKVLLVTMSSTVVNWAISIYQTRVDQWK